MTEKIQQLHSEDQYEAQNVLTEFCTSSRWVTSMLKTRPYTSIEQMLRKSESSWLECQESDILEAFSGHPKIGDLNALKNKYAQKANIEQGQITLTEERILQQLHKMNTEYEQKFGFIFIICATGKSADEMLQAIKDRIQNNRITELKNGANNQLEITQLRIRRWWNEK